MEVNLNKRLGGLKEKIPDIQKTLESVRFLKLKRVRLFSQSARGVLPRGSIV